CGRMKLKRGRLTVLGHTNDQQAVFKESSIACFDELDGPQPSVTVQDLVTEQIRWESGFFKWVPLATTADFEDMCGYLFEGLALPPIDAFIADLPELHQLLLRIGVANTRRPDLLVVGRLDKISDHDQQRQLLERLVGLGKAQSVIAAHVNASDFEDRVSEVIEVPGLYEFQQRMKPAREIASQKKQEGTKGEAGNTTDKTDGINDEAEGRSSEAGGTRDEAEDTKDEAEGAEQQQ
ncbi:MAG: hypothetical protein M3Y23_02920, partial [Actinomycetota bacterium]|nr:hypothetical protein [Actinomycetota bacterium]